MGVRVEVDVGVAKGLAGVSVTAEADGGNGADETKRSEEVIFRDLWVQVTHIQRDILQRINRR